jgi:hypothetical protein
MRRLIKPVVLCALLVASAACHPGPLIGGTRVEAGGTIAGIVSASGGSVALTGRKVTVTNVATNAKYEATTATDGGYTIKVPEGTYHIEVELRPGETLSKRPDDTHINNSDLDPRRDFVVTVRPPS